MIIHRTSPFQPRFGKKTDTIKMLQCDEDIAPADKLRRLVSTLDGLYFHYRCKRMHMAKTWTAHWPEVAKDFQSEPQFADKFTQLNTGIKVLTNTEDLLSVENALKNTDFFKDANASSLLRTIHRKINELSRLNLPPDKALGLVKALEAEYTRAKQEKSKALGWNPYAISYSMQTFRFTPAMIPLKNQLKAEIEKCTDKAKLLALKEVLQQVSFKLPQDLVAAFYQQAKALGIPQKDLAT